MRYRTECSLQVIFHKIRLVYPTGVYFGYVRNTLTATYFMLFCVTSYHVFMRHVTSSYTVLWRLIGIYAFILIQSYCARFHMLLRSIYKRLRARARFWSGRFQARFGILKIRLAVREDTVPQCRSVIQNPTRGGGCSIVIVHFLCVCV